MTREQQYRLWDQASERVAQAIEASTLSRKEIAARVGTDESRVSRWVNRKERVGARYIVALTEVVGCDGHWLLTGEGSRERAS